MAITGRIDYATDILVGTPTGCWSVIGENGKHYFQASGAALGLGCAEDNTLGPSKTDAEISADVLSLTGLSGFASEGIVPVPGTPYIGMIRGDFSGNVYGVFYKVNSSGTLVLEGAFHYLSATSPLGGFGDYGHVACTLRIDDEVYIALNAESVGHGLGAVLARIPYTGTNIDAAPGGWDSRATKMAFPTGTVASSRRYWNWISLRHLGDGVVGALAYYGYDEGGPLIKYNVVNTAAQTAGSLIDLSADFPEVIASAGKLYDGSPSSSDFDDFTAPFISGNQVIWGRPYTDNIDTVQTIYYTMDDESNITYRRSSNVSGFTITAVNGDLESVRIWKDGPSTLLALVDRRFVYFTQFGGGRGGHTQIIGL